jgi:hypothetical protein
MDSKMKAMAGMQGNKPMPGDMGQHHQMGSDGLP